MGRIDLRRGNFLVRELIISAQAELNDSYELSLLFERQVLILEDLTLGEGYSDKDLVLDGVEEVVGDVLELQVVGHS